MTDTDIIAAIKENRNDRAFTDLYKLFPMIRKMVVSKKGSKEDAEDVFQESLVILCHKIHHTDFKLTAQLSTYLYSVCRFLWNDELKKREKQPSVPFDSINYKKTEDIPEDALEAEKKALMAMKVIHELGERCQELLLLFYSKKMKLYDIAIKMGYSSENTAKIQKYKCLEAAKKNLQVYKHHHSVI